MIFSHNHPSGVIEPSAADRAITREPKYALQLIGVRFLAHMVVGAGSPVSMAAGGLAASRMAGIIVRHAISSSISARATSDGQLEASGPRVERWSIILPAICIE